MKLDMRGNGDTHLMQPHPHNDILHPPNLHEAPESLFLWNWASRCTRAVCACSIGVNGLEVHVLVPKLTAQNSTQPDQPIYEHALQRLYGGNSNVFSIAKQ